jgi:hypothetical protein
MDPGDLLAQRPATPAARATPAAAGWNCVITPQRVPGRVALIKWGTAGALPSGYSGLRRPPACCRREPAERDARPDPVARGCAAMMELTAWDAFVSVVSHSGFFATYSCSGLTPQFSCCKA